MTSSPQKRIARPEMDRLFREGDWEFRLSVCHKEPHEPYPTPAYYNLPEGTLTVGFDFRERGDHIATVIYHKLPDGTLINARPKMLLIDGIQHIC